MKKILLLALVSLTCHAGIYMQKDDDGNIIYTDIPNNNSQPVSLTSVNSVPATTMSKPQETEQQTAQENLEVEAAIVENKPYLSFNIASPTNNATFQNQSTITVRLSINPPLQPGDMIQLFLDGQAIGQPVAKTSIDIVNITRGEHTLFAKLLNSAQQTLKQTESVKIFVHLANLNTRPRL